MYEVANPFWISAPAHLIFGVRSLTEVSVHRQSVTVIARAAPGGVGAGSLTTCSGAGSGSTWSRSGAGGWPRGGQRDFRGRATSSWCAARSRAAGGPWCGSWTLELIKGPDGDCRTAEPPSWRCGSRAPDQPAECVSSTGDRRPPPPLHVSWLNVLGADRAAFYRGRPI